MTTRDDQLEVPREARAAFIRHTGKRSFDDDAIREIAAPMTNAAAIRELRRVRDYVRDNAGSISVYDVANFALSRANVLEGWTPEGWIRDA